MISNERLRQQMAFLQEINRLKQIVRRTYLLDGSRRENDAEHSWHLSVMALQNCGNMRKNLSDNRLSKGI